MKKSTLFFKVMVLLALLVPWTGWGQTGEFNEEVGSLTIYMDEDGNLSKTEDGTFGASIKLSIDDVSSSQSLSDFVFTGKCEWQGERKELQTDEEGLLLISSESFQSMSGETSSFKAQVGKVIITHGEYVLVTIKKIAETIDWTDERSTHAEVTVYINENGEITKADKGSISQGSLTISLSNVNLADWSIAVIDYLPVFSGSEDIKNGLTWATITDNSGKTSSLRLSKNNGISISQHVPASVKLMIRKNDGSANGYIQFNFQKEEIEESAWNDEKNKQAEVTVYVDESGEIVSSDKGTVTNGKFVVSPSDVNLPDWSISRINQLAVLDGSQDIQDGLLWKTVINTEDNSTIELRVSSKGSVSVYDKLPESVKVMISKGDETGYLQINFEQKQSAWSDEENKQAEVTVYVNELGKIVSSDKGTVTDGKFVVSPSDVNLPDWSISRIDQLAVLDGSQDIQDGLLWETVINTEDNSTIELWVSSKESVSVYDKLPESVKVMISKGDETGYLQINFEQKESEIDDTSWTEGDEAQATVTIFINEEGNIVNADKGSLKEGTLAVTPADLGLADGWALSAQDRSIVLYGDAVVTEGLSWKTVFDASTPDPTGAITEFRVSKGETSVYSELPMQVKIKVEQDENVGYILVVLKPVVTISEDDINKGGDDEDENGTIEEEEVVFIKDVTGANYAVYDGLPHGLGMLEVSVDGKALTLSEAKDEYSVTYEGLEGEPIDAGTYSATITFNEAMGYSGTVTLTNSVVIAQRPITLYFSFEEGILEGEEFVLGENVFIDVKEGSFAEGEKAEFDELIEKGIISAKFALGETQSDGTVEVKLVSFNYPAGEVSGYDLKYSNYDPKLLTGHVKEHGEGGTETELPDAGEAGEDGTIDYPGEGGSGIIVGDVDIIDEETGIGGSGINYRQYELKFCETDFFPNLNDYEVEGLKLFSRHNKFYTKANGSFTIWYEKDGVKNGEYGDYRIYISRNGADGDYSELKLDEVSDYFQIRNVNSDIWVRIYYGTGFPVANEEITATDARAYAQANKIVVITPEPTDVQIISMAGAVVATDQVTGQREFANLAEGVYIVRMGETVIKLQVRN